MIEATDRVAVITGASRGLGAGLARHFLGKGLKLGLFARTAPPFTETDRCVVRSLDVTDADAVQRFARDVESTLGAIDLWINNAGVLAPIGPLRENDPAAWAQHVSVNLLGVFHGSQAYIRHLHTRGTAGVLINISSGAARNAYAGWSAYCATKAAVDRMSECVALEEAGIGLRVYSVAPGIIDTDMQGAIRSCSPEQFPMVQKFLDLKAEDRFSTPAFIGDQLLSLAFDPTNTARDVITSLARPTS